MLTVGESSALFAAQCVLQPANRILHLASSLVGLAVSFQLLIAEDLAGGFLHGSLGLLCRTFDSILIHVVCSLFVGTKTSSMFCSRHDRPLGRDPAAST